MGFFVRLYNFEIGTHNKQLVFATFDAANSQASVGCSGVALHSGENVVITLCPAKCDTGIVFERVDVNGPSAVIPATWDKVVDTRLSTIGNDYGMTVATIEHLMAALAGCGVDNAVIKINGSEVPIMDGSSGPFVFL